MPTVLVDTHAYLYVQGLLFIALPLTAWTILAGSHDAKLVALWCCSGLMTGIGFVLLGLRDQLPGVVALPVAAGLVFGAYLVGGCVLQRELGRPARWGGVLAVWAITLLGFHVALGAGTDAQELYGSTVGLAGAAWLAQLSFALAKQENTRSAKLLGAVYALAACASFLRVLAILGDWGEGHVPTAADYALVNVSALLTALYANLGYVGLVLERSRIQDKRRAADRHHEHTQRLVAEQHAQVLDAMRAQRREVLNEATPAMLHSIDAQGRLLAVSDTWLSKLGYTRAEVIGKASSDFLSPASREKAREFVLPGFFATGRCDNVDYEMVRKDGSVIDVLLSAVLERDAAGHASHSLAVIEDVTEKLARGMELAREQALRRQVELHASELNTLACERKEMFHVLAHEVRQPLNNASAALQSAAGVLAQSCEVAAADRLQRAQAVLGEVLSGLDNRLAAATLLASCDAAPTEEMDIDAVISIVLADMPSAERHRIRVQRLTPTRTAAMECGLMRLAVRNLLANALGYSPPGSPVVLRVLDCDEPLALVLEVIDQGKGIHADLVPRLFERGVRGAHGVDKPGSGLGLYIVRRVMELHGGQVEAIRQPEGGMTMRLVLPQGLGD
jgi:PAS domain S-box-containing protein